MLHRICYYTIFIRKVEVVRIKRNNGLTLDFKILLANVFDSNMVMAAERGQWFRKTRMMDKSNYG